MSNNRAIVHKDIPVSRQLNSLQNGTYSQVSDSIGMTVETTIDIPEEIQNDKDAIAAHIQEVLNRITAQNPGIHFLVNLGYDDEKNAGFEEVF